MTTISDIQFAVAVEFKIPVRKMSEPINRGLGKTGRNAREISHPRQIAMYLASELTHHSLKRLGYYFGGRDHSTIIAGIRAAEKRIASDPKLARKVRAIRNRLICNQVVDNPVPSLVTPELQAA